jgi:DNA ligase N terminus/ATP dependent DNA ligase domain
MKFCDFLELLESLNPGDRKGCKKAFRDFFRAFVLCLDDETRLKTLRSLMLLLFSSMDKSRSYLIKETRLVSLLAQVFNFNRKQKEQLSRWEVQDPEMDNYLLEWSLGDFGAYLEKFLIGHGIGICDEYKRSPTTIFEITDLLNSLSKLSSWTTSDAKASHFDSRLGYMQSLFLPHCPKASKWIARIILKSFNSFNFKPDQLMREIHPCLYSIYCQVGKLESTADILNEIISCGYSGEEMFDESGNLIKSKYAWIMQTFANPSLGERIVCMESIQASSVAHVYHHQRYECNEKEFVAQLKYDGERMQIHLDTESNPLKIWIYSKTGRDSTKDRIHSHGIIKKALLSKLGVDGKPLVKSCIVEAELLVLDRGIEVFIARNQQIGSFWRGPSF